MTVKLKNIKVCYRSIITEESFLKPRVGAGGEVGLVGGKVPIPINMRSGNSYVEEISTSLNILVLEMGVLDQLDESHVGIKIARSINNLR